MRIVIISLLGVLLLSGCGGTATSFKESDIVVLTSESVPPNFQGDGERITKLSTLIMQEMFQKMQIAPIVKTLPWTEAYQQTMDEQNTALYAVVQTGARRGQFKWVGPLLIEDGTEFFIAFNKRTPAESVDVWSQALNDIKKDGTYRRIITEFNRNQ
ncbi:MAG: hypothetical protein EOM20_00875 [Spartobacteria bacterium]|nr:hypothetical protein [Spartobacteria bacterium]